MPADEPKTTSRAPTASNPAAQDPRRKGPRRGSAVGDKAGDKADAGKGDRRPPAAGDKADAGDSRGRGSRRPSAAVGGDKAGDKAAGGKGARPPTVVGGGKTKAEAKAADDKNAGGKMARRRSGSSRPPRGPRASRSPRDTRRRPGRAVQDRLAAVDEATRAARVAALRRLGIGVGAVVLGLLLVYSVFPVGAILDQHSATNRAEEQLEVLGEENARLEERRDRLQKDEEIERLAREQYGFVLPGEEAYALLPPPAPTTTTTVPEP